MSNKKDEFPRDLRAYFYGGPEVDPDGTVCMLAYPIRAYWGVWMTMQELKKEIEDLNTPASENQELRDELQELRDELDSFTKELIYLRKRILRGYDPAHLNQIGKKGSGNSIKMDYGAKTKTQKLLDDIDAGRLDPSKISKTLKAVCSALSFEIKHNRMPSHRELKALGYNDQQATDAGEWLKEQNQPHPHPLFYPLDQPKRGRPPKKK